MTRDRLVEEWGPNGLSAQQQWHDSWKQVEQAVADELAEQRLLRISSYDWHSELDERPLAWNGTELVLRALNAERGIIMIGGARR